MFTMYAGIAILVFAVYCLVTEKLPIHITSLIIIFSSLLTNVVSTKEFLSVFSSPAPIIIMCMFIISAALNETGIINALGDLCLQAVEHSKSLAIAGLFLLTMILSAFINNTPVVLILTPIVIMIAKKLNDYPSRYLIPLSYLSILGGICTLIGTSTNILVADKAHELGLAEFGIFDITAPALCLAVIGTTYIVIFAKHLLPKRHLEKIDSEPGVERKQYVSEILVSGNSSLIGKKINDHDFKNTEFELIDIIRQNMSFRNHYLISKDQLYDKELNIGDKLVIKSATDEILSIKEALNVDNSGFYYFDTKKTIVVEGVITPESRLIGLQASKLKLRRLYGCYLLAVHRKNQSLKQDFDKIIIEDGDILLVEGDEQDINRMMFGECINSISKLLSKKVRKTRGMLSVLAISFVIVGSSLQIMPIAGLAAMGASFVIISKCISLNKAIKSIEWNIILLILSMLTLSIAMQNSGLLDSIVTFITPHFDVNNPLQLLFFIYVMSWLLTELVSNNAVALLVTPIAIQLSSNFGFNPIPFTVAVMFASSASFSTPIGYQTNTFVHAVGNYKFTDFMKFGIPLNLILIVASCYIIPYFWELNPSL
jgi:di/tricarboxylate transporter